MWKKKGNGSGIILHCLSHSLACELNLQLLSPLILRYSLLANKFGVLLIHKRVDYHKFVVMFTQFSQVTFLKASFSCKKFMNFFNFEKKSTALHPRSYHSSHLVCSMVFTYIYVCDLCTLSQKRTYTRN